MKRNSVNARGLELRKSEREPDREIDLITRRLDVESCWNRNMFKLRDVQLKELQAKPIYYDVILGQTEPVSLEVIAKDYGKSEDELFSYLLRKRVILSRPGLVYPNPEYACKGYTSTLWEEGQKGPNVLGSVDDYEMAASVGDVYILWTQKGRLWLYELFKSAGWLPLMEQGKTDDERFKHDYNESILGSLSNEKSVEVAEQGGELEEVPKQ